MGWDEALMAVVDLANVACGFHASDQDHMRKLSDWPPSMG